MTDYIVDATYNPTNNTMAFAGAANTHGDIPIPVQGPGEKWITINLSGADEIVGIKIASSESGLATASAQSSGNYAGTCFENLELSTDKLELKMQDTGTTEEIWYYQLGVVYGGNEEWPDPKIENETSGGGGTKLPPGLYFR